MRVDLPREAWVELRDPEMVSERQRRPLVAAMSALVHGQDAAASTVEIPDDALLRLEDLKAVLAVCLIESWSFPDDPSVDTFIDLPLLYSRPIHEAAAPSMGVLLPDFSVDGAADPKASTAS